MYLQPDVKITYSMLLSEKLSRKILCDRRCDGLKYAPLKLRNIILSNV